MTAEQEKLIELKQKLEKAEALEYWQLVRRLKIQIKAIEIINSGAGIWN